MASTAPGTEASTPMQQDSKPASIAPMNDEEKQKPATGADAQGEFVRPLSTWQWVLVCTGLYLAAMLYGWYPAVDFF